MKEKKFRAWDKKLKEMIPLRGFVQNTNTCWYTLHTEPKGYRTVRIPYDAVLMQFTGLHDKNGKEIYEGDIVKYPDEHFGEWTGTVEYDDGIFTADGGNPLRDIGPEAIEIIGTIHDKEKGDKQQTTVASPE